MFPKKKNTKHIEILIQNRDFIIFFYFSIQLNTLIFLIKHDNSIYIIIINNINVKKVLYKVKFYI